MTQSNLPPRGWGYKPKPSVSARDEVLRLRCRCGKMIVQPSEDCEWHAARIKKALELREKVGSVEY